MLLAIYLIASVLMSMVFYIICNVWKNDKQLLILLFSIVLGFSMVYLIAIPILFFCLVYRVIHGE